MRYRLALGAVSLGIALLVAGCNQQRQGVVALSASPSILPTAGGSTTLHWSGNGVANYTLKVSPTASVTVNGGAYTGPVDLNTDTSATATLPSNGTAGNVVYTFTVLASDASGDPLASQTTTVTVPISSNGLWVPDYGANAIDFFAAGSLGSTSTPAAAITSGIDNARAVAFDASGNLWIANENAGTIAEYAAAALTTDPTPAATIHAPVGVLGLAFDASGNLWVTNYYDNTVSEYSAASLTANPPAVRSITHLQVPESLAFDGSGNLWIANWGNSTVTEYTAASLSSTPTLGATIATGLDHPEGLAFDASGNLWVGNQSGGTVVRYAAGSLTSDPDPAATITTGSTNNVGVTLDASGNLWVTHQGAKVEEFAAADVASTGSPAPIATISGLSAAAQMPAFDPPPANLPLHH